MWSHLGSNQGPPNLVRCSNQLSYRTVSPGRKIPKTKFQITRYELGLEAAILPAIHFFFFFLIYLAQSRIAATLPPEEPQRSRHIADFIAGMTDRYAIARYREVVGPIDLPEGF